LLQDGLTGLYKAAENGHAAVVHLFQESKAKVDTADQVLPHIAASLPFRFLHDGSF
jgi:hypothetical protein